MTQEEIHTELSALLSRSLEDIEAFLTLYQTLSRETNALLISRRWTVGSRLVFRRSAHHIEAAESAQQTADASSDWFLGQRPQFDAVLANRRTDNSNTLLPLSIAVKESTEALAKITAISQEQKLLAHKIRKSIAWRLGDFLVNRIAKTLLRKPNQDTRWAPHIIDEATQKADELAHGHDARARQFSALIDECIENGHFSREDYDSKTLGNFSELTNASPTLFSLELKPTDRIISVIVPVFNAPAETRACIESLLRHTASQHPILLIDDASTDEQIPPMLEEFAAKYDQIQAIHSESNAGFPATVNKGFDMTKGDVVVLNSDTVVTPRWLEKLEDAAYSIDSVATVTPLTNSGGAFSVPKRDASNTLPDFLTVDMAADLLERLSRRVRPEVPTAMGFCMYIRRATLDATGYFDAERFREGYGEENDFCMRAEEQGFLHLIDDATFIYHAEGASFKDKTLEFKQRGSAILDELYPPYRERIGAWLQHDELAALRQALEPVWSGQLPVPIDTYLLPDSRTSILYILHDAKGGAVQHAEHLIRSLSPTHRCLSLRMGLQSWNIEVLYGDRLNTIKSFQFDTAWDIKLTAEPQRCDALKSIIEEFSIDIAHVHHTIYGAPELIPLLKQSGCRVLYSLHDFYSVCPAFNLVDQDLVYCGGTCTSGPGQCDLRIDGAQISDLKHDYIKTWRTRITESIQHSDEVICFSESQRNLIQTIYPNLKDRNIQLISHGIDTTGFSQCATEQLPSNRIRVVILGTLSPAKGSGLLEDLLILNAENRGPFEFHFLGDPRMKINPQEFGAVAHGPYNRSDLPALLREINPSLGLIPSLGPETFSLTLSEFWAAGLPVLASNIGVFRERIHATGGGWLIDPGDPDQWYQEMQRIAQDETDYQDKTSAVQAIHVKTMGEMVNDYTKFYQEMERNLSET